MISIRIDSDFTDYYDSLQDTGSIYTYSRIRVPQQRAIELRTLKSLGIQTIGIKPVSQYLPNERIVVYKNALGHSSSGKEIMDASVAMLKYSNSAASIYYDSDYSIKMIQIGKIQLVLYFKNIKNELALGKLVDIKVNQSDYNRSIGLPIYSIDYIVINNKMVATDFNTVEKLDKYGIKHIIDGETIINEISNALVMYNKL